MGEKTSNDISSESTQQICSPIFTHTPTKSLSLSLKSACVAGLNIIAFNSRTCPTSTTFRDITVSNMSALERDGTCQGHSNSNICDHADGLPIRLPTVLVHSNIHPNFLYET